MNPVRVSISNAEAVTCTKTLRVGESPRCDNVQRHRGVVVVKGRVEGIERQHVGLSASSLHPIGFRSESGSDGLKNGVGLGKLAALQFGIDGFAVDRDLETTAARRNQLQRADALLQFKEFFRQTDGMRFVVSDRAVFNGDFQTHKRANARARKTARQAFRPATVDAADGH
jgi:hypothetical protein